MNRQQLPLSPGTSLGYPRIKAKAQASQYWRQGSQTCWLETLNRLRPRSFQASCQAKSETRTTAIWTTMATAPTSRCKWANSGLSPRRNQSTMSQVSRTFRRISLRSRLWSRCPRIQLTFSPKLTIWMSVGAHRSSHTRNPMQPTLVSITRAATAQDCRRALFIQVLTRRRCKTNSHWQETNWKAWIPPLRTNSNSTPIISLKIRIQSLGRQLTSRWLWMPSNQKKQLIHRNSMTKSLKN